MPNSHLEAAWDALATFAERENWFYSESKQSWVWCGPADPPWQFAMDQLQEHGTALLSESAKEG